MKRHQILGEGAGGTVIVSPENPSRAIKLMPSQKYAVAEAMVYGVLNAAGYKHVPRMHSLTIRRSPKLYALEMDKVSGPTLAQYCVSTHASAEVVKHVVFQLLLRIQDMAADLGFVHGDLNSSNVMLVTELGDSKQEEVTRNGKRYRVDTSVKPVLIDFELGSFLEPNNNSDVVAVIDQLLKSSYYRDKVPRAFQAQLDSIASKLERLLPESFLAAHDTVTCINAIVESDVLVCGSPVVHSATPDGATRTVVIG